MCDGRGTRTGKELLKQSAVWKAEHGTTSEGEMLYNKKLKMQ